MEALIPAPADCEEPSMIKFLKAQSIPPIKINRQLCQVYGDTRLDGQHISSRSSAGRCLIIIHPLDRLLQLKKFLSSQRQSFQNDRDSEMSVTVVPIPGGQSFTIQEYKSWSHCMTNVLIAEVNILKK